MQSKGIRLHKLGAMTPLDQNPQDPSNFSRYARVALVMWQEALCRVHM